jgi:adenine-specific DNA-methyltransferase
MGEFIARGIVVFGPDHTTVPRVRTNLFEKGDQVLKSVHYSYAQTAAQQFDAIFDGHRVFDNPKPWPDLAKLVEYLSEEDDLVMDFFAGSASTGHAVFDRNRALGTRRSFLLVQLPERLDTATKTGAEALSLGMRTIADIGKERLRRVSKQLRQGRNKNSTEDLGFRVMRLAQSNFRAWKDYEGDNVNRIIELFAEAEHPLNDEWTPAGLLIETMLLEGFPLDAKQISLGSVKRNKVMEVTTDYGTNKLVACFDDRLHADTIMALDLAETDVFVCFDRALTDEAKIRLADRCILKTI